MAVLAAASEEVVAGHMADLADLADQAGQEGLEVQEVAHSGRLALEVPTRAKSP